METLAGLTEVLVLTAAPCLLMETTLSLHPARLPTAVNWRSVGRG